LQRGKIDAMVGTFDMRLFALLTARLCHDLAGPVAAVGHGVEMLADPDPEFADDAKRLVAASATGAASRLRFYRFAYGFGGDAAGSAAEAPSGLARRFFAATPIACSWEPSAGLLPPEYQRLTCNLLLVAAEALPRGGMLTVTAGPSELLVDAEGEAASLPPELLPALAAAAPAAGLTPKTAQAYLCALLAVRLGRRLQVARAEKGRVRIAAVEGC
jgi:histidine phosphotransferase ChpT